MVRILFFSVIFFCYFLPKNWQECNILLQKNGKRTQLINPKNKKLLFLIFTVKYSYVTVSGFCNDSTVSSIFFVRSSNSSTISSIFFTRSSNPSK